MSQFGNAAKKIFARIKDIAAGHELNIPTGFVELHGGSNPRGGVAQARLNVKGSVMRDSWKVTHELLERGDWKWNNVLFEGSTDGVLTFLGNQAPQAPRAKQAIKAIEAFRAAMA